MLTKKVRFTNFYDKKNIKQINNRLRNFKKNKFFKRIPFFNKLFKIIQIWLFKKLSIKIKKT